jgi:hypothetical protein
MTASADVIFEIASLFPILGSFSPRPDRVDRPRVEKGVRSQLGQVTQTWPRRTLRGDAVKGGAGSGPLDHPIQ